MNDDAPRNWMSTFLYTLPSTVSVDGHQLVFPVGVLEVDEDRAVRRQVVERHRRGHGADGRLGHARPWRYRAGGLSAAAPVQALRLDVGHRRVAFRGIQALVAVLVELLDERRGRAHTAKTAGKLRRGFERYGRAVAMDDEGDGAGRQHARRCCCEHSECGLHDEYPAAFRIERDPPFD
jgi:hypothetical protein